MPVGVSTARRDLWSAFRRKSSVVRAPEGVVELVMAFVVGFMERGRRVNVSGDSMVGEVGLQCCVPKD